METARIWTGIGSYDREGRFCINQVTGPDEYTALVNNNYYTNAMAQMHLNFAASVAEQLQAQEPAEFARIAAAMALDANEPAAWRRAASLMSWPRRRRRRSTAIVSGACTFAIRKRVSDMCQRCQ